MHSRHGGCPGRLGSPPGGSTSERFCSSNGGTRLRCGCIPAYTRSPRRVGGGRDTTGYGPLAPPATESTCAAIDARTASTLCSWSSACCCCSCCVLRTRDASLPDTLRGAAMSAGDVGTLVAPAVSRR